VKRAADDLGVSQSALRSYLRKDRKAAAVKGKIQAEWRAKANAKTNAKIEELKRTNARFRALMEAAERGEPEKPIKLDFAILDECAREWSDKLKNLKIVTFEHGEDNAET
jgi:predicted transcriptional regulator